MNAFVDRYWTSREGLRLHAFDHPAAAGEAKLPVICLHGLTRNARDFTELAPRIAAAARRVLTVDVRGRGGSARDPNADYRLPAYADDVVRLMDALGLARAVFVGTSMGGLITMELAARRPELIAAAVVNDVGPELALEGLVRIAGYVGTAPCFADWDAAAGYYQRQNEIALPHYRSADWLGMARRLACEEGGAIVPDYDPDIALPFRDAPTSDDPWAKWRALAEAAPVLLLRGGLSDLLAAEAAARMAAASPDVTLVEVPAVGHAPMLDEPVALAAIERFLDALP